MTTDLFAPAATGTSAEQAGHDLLLRLAGRLPDAALWRLRDWLAVDARTVLGATLPRALLRHRVGITESEYELLVDAVGGWGASRRQLDAVLPVDVADEPGTDFGPAPSEIDSAALAVVAVVRGHPGCLEVHRARRAADGRPGARDRPVQDVVLVRGGDRPWALAGTLQRLLRALGHRTPAVEVLPPHGEPPAYHRAALRASAPLWLTTTTPVGG